ncbi:MAG: lysophospholipid acyltransferase family protein [Planctomycetota bacterium]
MGELPRREASALQRRVIHPAVFAALRTAMLPIHAAPPPEVVRVAGGLGAWFGSLKLNRKRVDRAVDRLEVAMPELDRPARARLVNESYAHLCRLAVEIALAPRVLTESGWPESLDLGTLPRAIPATFRDRPVLFVSGHCGNWEMIGSAVALLGYPMHALYRPLDLAPLDKWVRRLRERRGLMLVDKFGAAKTLPGLLKRGESLGFVADQNAGDRGMFVPFFGRLASTYKTIALLAIQYNASVVVGQALRTGQGSGEQAAGQRPSTTGLSYRMHVEDVIGPEDWQGQPDPAFYLTARYRLAIERMVRAAPEQYLWMHRIWKSRPRHERAAAGFPPRLREKLEQLPWMTAAGVDAIVDRSDRDTRWLQDQGTDRLP